jgi:hypothetical protein
MGMPVSGHWGYPTPIFSEVVVNARFIFSRVKKIAKV